MVTRTYEEGDGTKRGVAEIVAGDVQFLGTRGNEPRAESPEGVGRVDVVSPEEIPF
jgi:single-stranded DNA-binding protein